MKEIKLLIGEVKDRLAEIEKLMADKEKIVTSWDEVDLFKGDRFWVVDFDTNPNGDICGSYMLENWPLNGYDTTPTEAFSSYESAEKWIEEQNKPKFTDVLLFTKGHYELVYKDQIELNGDGVNFIIKPSDLEDILHALKSL